MWCTRAGTDCVYVTVPYRGEARVPFGTRVGWGTSGGSGTFLGDRTDPEHSGRTGMGGTQCIQTERCGSPPKTFRPAHPTGVDYHPRPTPQTHPDHGEWGMTHQVGRGPGGRHTVGVGSRVRRYCHCQTSTGPVSSPGDSCHRDPRTRVPGSDGCPRVSPGSGERRVRTPRSGRS